MTEVASKNRRLISIVLPDMRGGGAERLHINLAHAWLQAGYRVDFVLLQEEGELLELLPAGATVYTLRANRIRSAVTPLRRYLRKRKPDVTLAAMWPLTTVAVAAWVLAARPGKLFLSDHNQLSVSCGEELGTPIWFLKGSIRASYRWATGIITVSNGVKADVCSLGALKPEQVSVIYNPAALEVDVAGVSKSLRTSLWGDENGFNVLSVGTLKSQKDHASLLHAFARLPKACPARLVVLGDGGLRSELLRLTNELGLASKVRFAGFVVDPADWFRTSDLFVLSSRWEGFGNVIVEALSFGVPVISTDCKSGPSEILENGRYGTLVPVRDPQALADAIALAPGLHVDRALLIARSRDYSVSAISEQYSRLMGLQA